MSLYQVQLRVRRALKALFKHDWALLDGDASERAIASRLASHLEPLFPGYNVDVEYNRHGLDPKAVELGATCRGGGKKLIVPDVIVHHRRNDDNNLLVIEMKKETNSESRECDRAKIVAMKRELNYQYGLIIDLPAGAGAEQREYLEEWF